VVEASEVVPPVLTTPPVPPVAVPLGFSLSEPQAESVVKMRSVAEVRGIVLM
jgi:hypothetical protein